MTVPISVYVKMSPRGEKVPCRLYFKNNDTCLVDFETERPGLLVAGQFFVFYNRALDRGKVIGSAIVEVGGVFKDGKFNTLPVNKKESDEEEKNSHEDEKVHF
jgi:tRNA-specific 2-thiouridylase